MGLGKTIQAIAFIAAIKGGKALQQRSLFSFWKQNKNNHQSQKQTQCRSTDSCMSRSTSKNDVYPTQNIEHNQAIQNIENFCSSSSSSSSFDSNEKLEFQESEQLDVPHNDTRLVSQPPCEKKKTSQTKQISSKPLPLVIDLENENIPSSSNPVSHEKPQSLSNCEDPSLSDCLTQLPVLIICPASILQHWSREFLRVCC